MSGRTLAAYGPPSALVVFLASFVLWTVYVGATDRPPPRDARASDPLSETQGAAGVAETAGIVTLTAVETCGGGTTELNLAEKRMLDLHNEERGERGIGPLCINPDLTSTARARSRDMLDREYFDHTTPEAETVTDQLKRMGYASYLVGENISRGTESSGSHTPEDRFRSLMGSPGHKANILRREFDEVGVGALAGAYGPYDDTVVYTVVFGGGRIEPGAER